jgi:hypothetical protein
VGLWEGVFSADILVGVREVEAVGDYGTWVSETTKKKENMGGEYVVSAH